MFSMFPKFQVPEQFCAARFFIVFEFLFISPTVKCVKVWVK